MSERKEWLFHPETKEFRKLLEARVEDYKEMFANGNTLVVENADATQAYTAGIKGKIEELRDLIDILHGGE